MHIGSYAGITSTEGLLGSKIFKRVASNAYKACSYDLVEGHGSIEGDVLVEGGLPEEGDEVVCHGQ